MTMLEVVRQAVDAARRAGADYADARWVLAEVEPVTDTWETAVQEDPFNVSLEEKVSLLMEASRRMRAVPGLSFAEAMLDFYRKRSALATSEGAAIEQTITHSGGGIEATAIGNGELQRRS